jgi:hypothetical protein
MVTVNPSISGVCNLREGLVSAKISEFPDKLILNIKITKKHAIGLHLNIFNFITNFTNFHLLINVCVILCDNITKNIKNNP